MTPKFRVGDKVTAIALPNGFPKPSAEIHGLTVTQIRLVGPFTYDPTFKPYYRVLTTYPNGFTAVEGAERFFELE